VQNTADANFYLIYLRHKRDQVLERPSNRGEEESSHKAAISSVVKNDGRQKISEEIETVGCSSGET